MNFKQVYLYNGTPYLAYKNEDGEYEYPQDEWTDVAPPEGIYMPYYFDGSEWIGTSEEDWEENNPKGDYEPTDVEKDLAKTQMKSFNTQIELEVIRQDQAHAMEEIFKLKKGME